VTTESKVPTLMSVRSRRAEITAAAVRRGARTIRVFGSVARGDACEDSDVDFVVEMEPGRSVLDVSELILDLEELLGRKVDVFEVRSSSEIEREIERQARPI
jgi:uncharacterized protein